MIYHATSRLLSSVAFRVGSVGSEAVTTACCRSAGLRGRLVSDGVITLIVLGYLLDGLICFTAGYLLGRRRRPPRRVQTRLR